MTTIIGIKKDNSVWIGADSIASNGHDKFTVANPKVFKKDNMLIGYTTSFRIGQLLQYSVNTPTDDYGVSAHEYMVTRYIPEVIKCFEENKCLSTDDNNVSVGGDFLVGYRGELFTVQSDFSVNQWLSNFAVVGHGTEYALGAMQILNKIDYLPDDKINMALEAVSNVSVFTVRPFHVMQL